MRVFGFLSSAVTLGLLVACGGSDPASSTSATSAGPATGAGGGSTSGATVTGAGGATTATTVGVGGGGGATTTSGAGGSGGAGVGGGGGSGGCQLTDCGGECVDTQTSFQHCGGCDQPCASGPQLEGFTACEGGACVIDCFNGHEDCNGDIVDGCEASIEDDAANCGMCGYACDTSCNNGTCAWTTVVAGLSSPIEIALDATDVYFTDSNGIRTVPKGGGAPTTLAAAAQGAVSDLAVDPTRVYWTDATAGFVKSVLKGGGSLVVHGTSNMFELKGVAVSADTLYWATGFGGSIHGVPLAGGAAATLASGQGYTNAVALDGTTLVWSQTVSMGGLWRLPQGAMVPELVVAASQPSAISIASGTVYFAANQDINSVPVAGGAITVLVPNVGSSVLDLVTDGVHVYWITDPPMPGQGSVMRVPVNGGAPKQLAGSLSNPARIAVDGAHLYWTDVLQNNIKRISK